jgi:hypothetical protein
MRSPLGLKKSGASLTGRPRGLVLTVQHSPHTSHPLILVFFGDIEFDGGPSLAVSCLKSAALAQTLPSNIATYGRHEEA